MLEAGGRVGWAGEGAGSKGRMRRLPRTIELAVFPTSAAACRSVSPARLGEPISRRTSGGGLGVEIDVSENRRRAVEFRVNILRRSHGGKGGDNPAQAELRRTVRGLNRHTSRYRPKGGLMNDASFILTPARYLLQIAHEGEWKTVAYLVTQ